MIRVLKQTVLVLLAVVGIALVVAPAAYAQSTQTPAQRCIASGGKPLADNDKVCCPTNYADDGWECFSAKYLNPVIVTLGALTGIAVVIGIVMGGIQYASSAGDPQRAAKGKASITKALIGLVSFLFLYSMLQFFSPGGLASSPVPDGSGGTIANQCSKEFLGLKPWFAYLPNKVGGVNTFTPGTCNIDNFELFGENGMVGYVVLAIADDLIRIAALIAVAFVVVGGIQFVTSQGDPEKAKKARQTILNAIIGVIVAILAAAIVSYIGGRLSA